MLWRVYYQTKSFTIVTIIGVKLSLELDKTQAALLKALSPRGAAAAKTDTPMEDTALRILTSGMQREATMRRINTEAVLGVALVEAAKRRRERENRN